jgi:hydroxymethylpyrimidine pyrophosphatase-like HAD family hydrolase
MKISVLALDYDGTIAAGDVLDPSVRNAIAAARTRGLTVLLVTGRILSELRRVAGDLHFVDAVVAENGAVVHFPDSGRTSRLGSPLAKFQSRRASVSLTPTLTTRWTSCASSATSSCRSCSSSTAAAS